MVSSAQCYFCLFSLPMNLGYVMKINGLEKMVITGKVEGKRWQRRRHFDWVDASWRTWVHRSSLMWLKTDSCGQAVLDLEEEEEMKIKWKLRTKRTLTSGQRCCVTRLVNAAVDSESVITIIFSAHCTSVIKLQTQTQWSPQIHTALWHFGY